MKLFYCGGCGVPISGQGKYGLCRTCARARRPKTVFGEKIETIRASVLVGIKENMKTFGVHPQCRYCRRDCKTYNAPGSEILYCPRMKNDVLKVHPIFYLTDIL
jgi:hypothetical protein